VKTCPHCGEVLLSNKEPLPKRLTQNHKDIIEFCKAPYSATQIAEGLGITMPAVYKRIRVLQRMGYIQKMQDPRALGYNHGCTFISTDRPYAEAIKVRTSVLGVRL
jgi:predicted transcriptional regulator